LNQVIVVLIWKRKKVLLTLLKANSIILK
jgi:hypothetical protein